MSKRKNVKGAMAKEEILEYWLEINCQKLLKNVEKMRELADYWERIAKNATPENCESLGAELTVAGSVVMAIERQKELLEKNE